MIPVSTALHYFLRLSVVDLDGFVIFKMQREAASAVVRLRKQLSREFDDMLANPRGHERGPVNSKAVTAARNVIKLSFEDEKRKN